mgnify:CR=1 FL=1
MSATPKSDSVLDAGIQSSKRCNNNNLPKSDSVLNAGIQSSKRCNNNNLQQKMQQQPATNNATDVTYRSNKASSKYRRTTLLW